MYMLSNIFIKNEGKVVQWLKINIRETIYYLLAWNEGRPKSCHVPVQVKNKLQLQMYICSPDSMELGFRSTQRLIVRILWQILDL